MKSHLYFLSGLPRSGSTVLASILNQNPEIYTTPTSPLADLLCYVDESFSRLDFQYTYDKPNITENTYKAILSNFYNHIEKPYVIDKHRAWCRNLNSIKRFTGVPPKVIATNRRIPEVLASYLLLIERNNTSNNFIDNFLRENNIPITNDNRVKYLWKKYITDPYQSLVFGLEHFPDNIHLVNYDDLVSSPESTMNKIYEFLELPKYNHDFSNIINTCSEDKDDAWGLENLHQIRSKLERTSPSPEKVIGYENTELYDKLNI